MLLGPEQLRAFDEDGFVLMPNVFDAAEVAEMGAAFERLRRTAEVLQHTQLHRGTQFVLDRQADGRVRIQRIVWCGAAEPVLLHYGSDPRLLRPAAQLLGASCVQQLINQAHFKLPGDGVEFPWHQDSVHRRYGSDEWRDVNGRGSYVQSIIALDEMTEANGPLQLVRGSCRLGHIKPAGPHAPLPGTLIEVERIVTAVMAPGSVLLFGPFTIHRSLPNRSTTARRVFINGFAYPGANSRVYPGEGAGRLLVAC